LAARADDPRARDGGRRRFHRHHQPATAGVVRDDSRLFPVVWVAIVLQLLSGFVLWMTKPTRYVADTAFMLKLSLVIIGIVLTLYFYAMMKRGAASWDAAGTVPSRGIKFAAASLLVWCGVLVAARLTAHLGSLYSG